MKNSNSYYNQQFYAIFRKNKDGVLHGLIENSFCMSWSTTRVRIFPKKYFKNDYWNLFLNKKELKKWIGIKRDEDVFLVRIRSKKSPVHINLDTITPDMNKFNFRNKIFTLK